MSRRTATRFAGVLGWPLEHSLSPAIHNAAFRRLGLDWIYLAWPVPPEMLEGAVAGLKALGAMGANVTMPHKSAIVGRLDEISGDARSIGAVNTVQNLGDRLIGHNTDIDGFKGLVSDAGTDIRGRRALVLGAGGAARAVVKALADMGAAEISVAARRPDLAQEVVALIGTSAGAAVGWSDAAGHAIEVDVVVNATPLGMSGVAAGDALPDVEWRRGQLVVDLIYDPPATNMVERARASGADAWGGIGMLVHQAAASFQIWTGLQPPIETMSAAAVHALGHRGR